RTIFTGAISGAFSLTKVGSGTLALGGANTFSGGFTLGSTALTSPGSGTLEIQSSSTNSNPPASGPLGTGTFTVNQIVPGASAAFAATGIVATGGTRTVTNTLALNGNFTVLSGSD